MKNMLAKVKVGIERYPEAIKSVYGNALDKLNTGLSKIANMGSETKSKVLDFTNEIVSILPILEEFGYKASELRVGVSLPPSIEMDVLKVNEITKKDHDEKMEKYKARKMFNLIIKSLESARDIQDKVKIGDDYHHEFSLHITIPPNVGIKYRLKEMAN
ncbi:MAG: hypothetical protein RJQ09_15790 [Cyclobacteriaceae bacterium]